MLSWLSLETYPRPLDFQKPVTSVLEYWGQGWVNDNPTAKPIGKVGIKLTQILTPF